MPSLVLTADSDDFRKTCYLRIAHTYHIGTSSTLHPKHLTVQGLRLTSQQSQRFYASTTAASLSPQSPCSPCKTRQKFALPKALPSAPGALTPAPPPPPPPQKATLTSLSPKRWLPPSHSRSIQYQIPGGSRSSRDLKKISPGPPWSKRPQGPPRPFLPLHQMCGGSFGLEGMLLLLLRVILCSVAAQQPSQHHQG